MSIWILSGGCQVAEKDCRNRSLWVNLWVRIFRSECFLNFAMEPSLQFRVLGFGLLQDGDVGVGVFPEREEILIGRLGFGGVALHCIGSAYLEMRQCADG